MDTLAIILTALLALMHLSYAVQNLLNRQAALQAVADALAQQERPVYPRSWFPAIRNPWLLRLTLALICGLQLAAGMLLTAAVLFHLTHGLDPTEVRILALGGTGLGLVLWFGLFLGFANPVLQLWQTSPGANVLAGAAYNGLYCAVAWLIWI